MKQQPAVLKELKEVRLHGTKSFPCAIYRTHSIKKGIFVKHHWHDEIEILYFSGGEFRLEVNMESFPIQSECFYFINPGEYIVLLLRVLKAIGRMRLYFRLISWDLILVMRRRFV